MSRFKVPACWEVCGYLEVEAESVEEAIKVAKEEADTCDLPRSLGYVDGSFTVLEQPEEVIEIEK